MLFKKEWLKECDGNNRRQVIGGIGGHLGHLSVQTDSMMAARGPTTHTHKCCVCSWRTPELTGLSATSSSMRRDIPGGAHSPHTVCSLLQLHVSAWPQVARVGQQFLDNKDTDLLPGPSVPSTWNHSSTSGTSRICWINTLHCPGLGHPTSRCCRSESKLLEVKHSEGRNLQRLDHMGISFSLTVP